MDRIPNFTTIWIFIINLYIKEMKSSAATIRSTTVAVLPFNILEIMQGLINKYVSHWSCKSLNRWLHAATGKQWTLTTDCTAVLNKHNHSAPQWMWLGMCWKHHQVLANTYICKFAKNKMEITQNPWETLTVNSF